MSIKETLDLALQHHQAGQLSEAQGLYQQILSQQPNHPDALHLLGAISSQFGRHLDGAEMIRRAIELNPSAPHYHDNLGVALAAAGLNDQAIEAHRRAIALKPDFAQAHNHLGNALRTRGRDSEAVESFRRAVQLAPAYAEAHYNLGICLTALDRLPEAEAAYRNAIAVQPSYAEAYNNLGACLYDLGRLDESIANYQQALTLKPDYIDAYNNMGNAYRAKGEWAPATQWFQKAIGLQPDYALAHFNFGLLLLIQGQFERGWPEYEWRLRVNHFDLRHDFTQPVWDGSELGGRTVLLYGEQGIGDAIQFIRYLPKVSERGGKIVVMCHPHLHRLFRGVKLIEHLAPLDGPLPSHDVHCPLMSLPRVLGTTLGNIPAPVGYLQIDPAQSALWRPRLPRDGRLKVGLVWANRPNPADRCPTPATWAPLANAKNVWFASLQKPIAGSQLPPVPPGLELFDASQELHDFADTAALIDNLDLVISVDTAVAHLAAAMGKPVWTPLKFVPDWRWLLERTDSPWYPTMRLFRQPRLGDWQTPVEQITQALTELSTK